MEIADVKIAIVGATGLVGEKILEVLEKRKLIPGKLALIASEKSAGKIVQFAGNTYRVEPLSKKVFDDFNLAIFAAGSKVSSKWAPKFAEKGAIVIDKSSAWRADPSCPLVVPQINPGDLDNIPKGIIPSPNCSTIGFVLAIKPLIDTFGIPEHIFAATYQSVTGAGKTAGEALKKQRQSIDFAGPFDKPIYDNLLPMIGATDSYGFCTEESKLMTESRRILGIPDLKITATAVRVPIEIGHSEAVTIVFDKEIELAKAIDELKKAPVIKIRDDTDYPTPVEAAGTEDVLVGRIRKTPDDGRILSLFLTFDNLLRGAATNAVDIAEIIIGRAGD